MQFGENSYGGDAGSRTPVQNLNNIIYLQFRLFFNTILFC